MLYLVDGYAGTPHITAPQVGDYNAGITGGGSCVFNVGEKLRAEMVNANTVRIYDGCFLFQGSRRGGIQAGSYEDVSIDNGTQDQKRNDLILIKYEKDSASQKESLSLAVLKGTPGASAQDPSYSEGDIREGDLVCYMPLYRVKLDGINMTGVEKLFMERKSTVQLEQELDLVRDTADNAVKSTDYITNTDIDALDGNYEDIPDGENILLQLSEKIETKADNMTFTDGFLQLTSEGNRIGSAVGLPESSGGSTMIETINSTEINDLF